MNDIGPSVMGNVPTRHKPRRTLRVVAFVAGLLSLGFLLLVGGSNALERIDAMSGGIPSPANFPADFPVYSKAALNRWTWDSTQLSGTAMWVTTDSRNQVTTYYNQALAQGDCQDRAADLNAAIPRISFKRRSQPTYGGILTIQRNWLNGVVRISVEMGAGYWKAEQITLAGAPVTAPQEVASPLWTIDAPSAGPYDEAKSEEGLAAL
jgi:hypothetical protein